MHLNPVIYVLPFAVGLILIVAAEVRDRMERAKTGQGRSPEPVKLQLIPSLAVVGGAVIGAIIGGVGNDDFRFVLVAHSAAWSFLVLVSLVRILRRSPGPALCAGLSVLFAATSFLLVGGLT